MGADPHLSWGLSLLTESVVYIFLRIVGLGLIQPQPACKVRVVLPL